MLERIQRSSKVTCFLQPPWALPRTDHAGFLSSRFPLKERWGRTDTRKHRTFRQHHLKLVSLLIRENTFTRNGTRARFDHLECSKDGKTLTGTQSGIDIRGKPFHGTGAAITQKRMVALRRSW